MSYMFERYAEHRAQGHSHRGALKALGRRFDFDPGTVARVVERAERDAAPAGLSEKFPRLSASPEPSSARANANMRGHG